MDDKAQIGAIEPRHVQGVMRGRKGESEGSMEVG